MARSSKPHKESNCLEDDIAAFINRLPTAEEWEAIQASYPWITALKVAETGDAGELIALLNSPTPLPAYARECIADLLSRRKLTKKRGGQQFPLYKASEPETRLRLAAMDLRKLEQSLGYDVALNAVAADWDIKPDVLDNYMKNKRGSSRRMRKR